MGRIKEKWIKNYGRVSYDFKYVCKVDEETGNVLNKKMVVSNIKQEFMWFIELPYEVQKYILDLIGMEMFVHDERPYFRCCSYLGCMFKLCPIMKDWQSKNIIKTTHNASMLNGHVDLKERPNKYCLTINTNTGEDVMKKEFGDLWVDFICDSSKKKVDAYLRMSPKDNMKILLDWLKYYCHRRSIFQHCMPFDFGMESWQDDTYEWPDCVDCGVCEWSYDIHKYGVALTFNDWYKTNIDLVFKDLVEAMTLGYIWYWEEPDDFHMLEPVHEAFKKNKKKYWVMASDCKFLGVASDWPILHLEKGNKKVKYPLSTSVGWGWNVGNNKNNCKMFSSKAKIDF
jgi:hypothetical protein